MLLSSSLSFSASSDKHLLISSSKSSSSLIPPFAFSFDDVDDFVDAPESLSYFSPSVR